MVVLLVLVMLARGLPLRAQLVVTNILGVCPPLENVWLAGLSIGGHVQRRLTPVAVAHAPRPCHIVKEGGMCEGA